MHILLHVAGIVKVDHMLHFGDVETSGSNRGPYDDWGLAAFERLEIFSLETSIHGREFKPQSFLPFMPSSVSVDGGEGEALSVEKLIQGISSTFCLIIS